jgi:hypothetical protein
MHGDQFSDEVWRGKALQLRHRHTLTTNSERAVVASYADKIDFCEKNGKPLAKKKKL